MNPAELFRQDSGTLDLGAGDFLFREGESGGTIGNLDKRTAPCAFSGAHLALFFGVRRVSQLLIFVLFAATGCGQRPAPVSDFASERQRMVREQLMSRGIHDERVLAAMSKVPREEFVPADERAAAYTDNPLPIGYDQTISQPYIVAFMTEQLHPKLSDRVLEVGTGSGYQAAILAEL